MKPCDALKPCQNLGNCTDDPGLLHGYSCMCLSGFNGTDCEFDIQLCQLNTCLYNGNLSLNHSKSMFFLFEVLVRN